MRINPITSQFNMTRPQTTHSLNARQVMSMSDMKIEKDICTFSNSPAKSSNINFQGGQDLLKAAKKGELEGVKREIEQNGVDVNYKGEIDNPGYMSKSEKTALITVCAEKKLSSEKRVAIIQELLKYPEIDVNAQDDWGWLALVYLCNSDDEDAVNELLKHPNVDVSLECGVDGDYKKIADFTKNDNIKSMVRSYKPGLDKRTLPDLLSLNKPQLDINKLSPEKNIWTKAEISAYFLNLIKPIPDFSPAIKDQELRLEHIRKASEMLLQTPLIDLEGNNQEILVEVCGTKAPELVERVFDYQEKQPQMLKDYEEKREAIFSKKLQNLSYSQLREQQLITLPEGFNFLMSKDEFNPNDTHSFYGKEITFFEQACLLDPSGKLAQDILSRFKNVNTERCVYLNKQIRSVIAQNRKSIMSGFSRFLNIFSSNANQAKSVLKV